MKKWSLTKEASKMGISKKAPMELSQLRDHDQRNTNNNGNISNNNQSIRRTDSPLPAVPLPEKKLTLGRRNRLLNDSRSNLSASCDNLLNAFFNGSPSKCSQHEGIGNDPNSILRANSLDFDCLDRMNEPLIPTTDNPPPKPFVRGVPHYSTNTMRSIQPIHDYEELPDHEKRDQILLLSRDQSGKEYISSPMSQLPGIQDNEASTAFDSSCHRERQNPMYLGMRAVSPLPDLEIGKSPRQNNAKVHTSLGKQCACAMLACLIVALIISVLSVVLVALFYLGVLTPVDFEKGSESKTEEISVLLSSLQNHINQSEERILKQNMTISILENKLTKLSKNKLNSEQEIIDVITSLNSTQVESIFGILKSKSRPDCRHETYSIGSSPLQKVSDSGEYYADKGFQITGASCSSTTGYTASLETRSQNNDNTAITYKCNCVQIPGSAAPTTGRVECRIDYWQCPVSSA